MVDGGDVVVRCSPLLRWVVVVFGSQEACAQTVSSVLNPASQAHKTLGTSVHLTHSYSTAQREQLKTIPKESRTRYIILVLNP